MSAQNVAAGFHADPLAGATRQAVDGAIVHFLSRPLDVTGLHTAVEVDDMNLTFPPVTLFKVPTAD